MILIGLLAATGCAAQPGSPPVSGTETIETVVPAPPEGRVLGSGTVMDVAGDIQLCQGAIMESLPPQCSGTPLVDWSWDGLAGCERVDDVRWGQYAVTGTYDGTSFTVTEAPVPLALFDPLSMDDAPDHGQGTSDESSLAEISDALSTRADEIDGFVGVSTGDGHVWLDVTWDDGSMQAVADGEFGEGIVVVRQRLVRLGDQPITSRDESDLPAGVSLGEPC